MKNTTSTTDSEAVRQKVRAGYGQIAKGSVSCCGSTPSSCGSTPVDSEQLARHVGYSAQELAALPEGANMGLSCGNPNALEIYDPAMCCSTGLCGPDVDPTLVRFAADLKWVADQGVEVRRFNLSQSPAAFVENARVKQALTDRGEAALPLVLAGDQVMSMGRYPERAELATWSGLSMPSAQPDACCCGEQDAAAPGSGKCCG